MIKSIIKEIVIILLLVIAIILILGIIFYDYNPENKKIPTSVEGYILPEEMQEELEETIKASTTQNIVKTYRVDGTDLDYYERSKDYESGRVHPFASTEQKVDTTQDSGNNSNNQDSTNQTSQNGTGTQGSFLNTVK